MSVNETVEKRGVLDILLTYLQHHEIWRKIKMLPNTHMQTRVPRWKSFDGVQIQSNREWKKLKRVLTFMSELKKNVKKDYGDIELWICDLD